MHRMSLARAVLRVVVAIAAGAWGVGCSSGNTATEAGGPGVDGGGGDGGANDGGNGSGPTALKLVANPRNASRLDTAIAKIILTEQMAVNVQVTELDAVAQWDPIASGDQHVSLEVWPSTQKDEVTKYVDTNKVENGGDLGPVGKISWYIPTYLVAANPLLASYQAYNISTNTDAFATADTGSKGRFLTGDPAWPQHDADIIKNLGLNLQVVAAGSEAAELAQIDSAYNKRGAVLFYLWSPHAALAKYDLTAVQLPPYDPAQYANAATGQVACDYPAEHLFKIMWTGLKAANPRAYQFLKNFKLTTKDQIELLGAVENDGKTVDEAAHTWLDANTATWQSWIPK